MSRILLVNRYACSNIGDQAIRAAMGKFILENFKSDVCSSDYTARLNKTLPLKPKTGTGFLKVRELLKKVLPLNFLWFIRNIFRIFRVLSNDRFDLVIIGGGQLLLPGRFAIAAYTWTSIAKFFNVKVVFSNVGIGGCLTRSDLFFIRSAISKSNGINLRDLESLTLIQNLLPGFDNVYLSSDIVFTLGQGSSCGNLYGRREGALIGIPDLSVYNHYNPPISRESYFELWWNVIRDKGYQLAASTLVYTTAEDYLEANRFSDYARDVHGVAIKLADYDDLDGYLELLRTSETVLSGRMHALILAMNNGCRVDVFPISPKLSSFENQIKGEEYTEIVRFSQDSTRQFLARFLN